MDKVRRKTPSRRSSLPLLKTVETELSTSADGYKLLFFDFKQTLPSASAVLWVQQFTKSMNHDLGNILANQVLTEAKGPSFHFCVHLNFPENYSTRELKMEISRKAF